MYPVLRFANTLLRNRKAPRVGLLEPHISTHLCWPWDIDPWVELNNGRTLTLFDLGRVGMATRAGMFSILRENGWGLAVAGNSLRYRRRIRAFDRFTMLTRILGWDGRFLYMEQTMWRKGECCNQMLLRGAITSGQGMIPPALMAQKAGHDPASPELPDWVQAWIEADAKRPWPPVSPEEAQAIAGKKETCQRRAA